MQDFKQIEWDAELVHDCRAIVQLALAEDLGHEHDWTTRALVPPEKEGRARIVAREPGIVAGMSAIPIFIAEAEAALQHTVFVSDGAHVGQDMALAEIRGNAGDLLTLERPVLNLLSRMMGIATLTASHVRKLSGTKARLYDTRKTTPGWRRLEKYAVRCGGACNHRTGLFDAVLIKDNHLAQFSGRNTASPAEVAAAVGEARKFLQSHKADLSLLPVEVEVDSLEQLEAVLAEAPDIVLLDNMGPEMLRQAVEQRNALAPNVQLEASGNVRLETLRKIAETGVDRISAGGLTHAARALDIGLDWLSDK